MGDPFQMVLNVLNLNESWGLLWNLPPQKCPVGMLAVIVTTRRTFTFFEDPGILTEAFPCYSYWGGG